MPCGFAHTKSLHYSWGENRVTFSGVAYPAAAMNRSTLDPPVLPVRLQQSPEVILATTSRIVMDTRQRETLHQERRSEQRWTVHQPVRVKPLSDEETAMPFDARDKAAFTAFIRDISPSGVGLLHARPIAAQRFLVRFDLIGGDSITVVVRIAWNCSLGDFGHASGGTIVAVLESVKDAPAKDKACR
jgi:hypothetical protein